MTLTKKEVGQLVKKSRKIKSEKLNGKYTQSMLAKDVGKSQSYIGDIEAGRLYPNYELLCKISKVCCVPFSFFADSNKNIKIYLQEKYPGLNLEHNPQIINYYRNTQSIKYDPEWYIERYYNENKSNDFTKSFEEWSNETPKALAPICDTSSKKIPIYYNPINIYKYKHSKRKNHNYMNCTNVKDEFFEINFLNDLDIKNNYIGLVVSDDSMILGGIKKNDIVIYQENIKIKDSSAIAIHKTVKKNSAHCNTMNLKTDNNPCFFNDDITITDGDLVVVTFNGKDACIRRYFKSNNIVEFKKESNNPKDKSELFDMNDIKNNIGFFQILGKVVKAIINF